jgi:hypothetical protein
MNSIIPQEKSAAVTRALDEAFGVTEYEDIRVIKDLASSLVFRIVVRGSPFLLKISMRTSDPARHYTCMKTAADAGLAPRVRYTSIADRISIEDFVQVAPFPLADAQAHMPAVLRRLHALRPFPGIPNHLNTTCTFLLNKGPALDGFIQRLHAGNILPKAEREELLTRYAEIAAVYQCREADMVSSHNDLFKPDNILFDRERVWLVDWEAAFLNDRYVDLAVVANLVVTNDAEEIDYLQGYFEEAPDEYQLARLFLMRQMAHIFYAMAFLFFGSPGNAIDWGEAVPEFSVFQRRFWAGEIKLEDNQTKTLYSRVHLEQLLRNVQLPRFKEALRIVEDR